MQAVALLTLTPKLRRGDARRCVPNEVAVNLERLFLELMRQAVRREIRTLIQDPREKDRLLTAQEGARMLSV